MKKKIIITIFLIAIYLITNHIYYRNHLILHTIDLSDVSEIDTIEAYPEKGLYVLGLVRSGFLGNFSYDLAIKK